MRGVDRFVRGGAAGAAVLVAVVLDGMGEAPAAVHPVVGFGRVIAALEQHAPVGPRAQLAYGAAILIVALPCAVIPAALLECGAQTICHRLEARGYGAWGVAAEVVILGAALTPLFAWRMLIQAGRDVRQALERDDLPAARESLRNLVSRDRSSLSAELVAAAAVESLAENLSDSVIAPLLAYACCGLPGVAAYRLVNTADAMIGYRGRYEHLGKAVARLDDLLNLIPARLTAAMIVLLAPWYGGDCREAWRIWRRDGGCTASPNAGQAMAAAAGALGVQLEKVDHYALGDPGQQVQVRNIRQAEQLVRRVGGCAIALLVLVAAGRGVIRAR